MNSRLNRIRRLEARQGVGDLRRLSVDTLRLQVAGIVCNLPPDRVAALRDGSGATPQSDRDRLAQAIARGDPAAIEAARAAVPLIQDSGANAAEAALAVWSDRRQECNPVSA